MTMMAYPLTLTSMFRRGIDLFPRKEIVSRSPGGEHRPPQLRQFGERTARLADALQELGIARGDRVGTFAWNNHRHLEAYFAVPCIGAVLHTLNIRLFPDQLVYIINHAEDQVLLIDADLLPVIEAIADRPDQRAPLRGDGRRAAARDHPPPVSSYEELLAGRAPLAAWPDDLDENAPSAMCYTSATTGNPKGVTYTHRSQFLHAMSVGLVDNLGLSGRDMCCLSCRCSMPMPGACRMPPSGSAPRWCCPARARSQGRAGPDPGRAGHPGRRGAHDLDRLRAAAGAARTRREQRARDDLRRLGRAARADREV